MGRASRKLMKKTRLERMQVHLNRLSQFNTNAMHEVGRLATALRVYADPAAWQGDFDEDRNPITVWKLKDDGPKLARDVLTSLGLPWDKMPQKEPVQDGRESVLKSLAEDLKKEEAGLAEDDRSGVVADAEAKYGRYNAEGEVVEVQAEGEDEAEVKAGAESEVDESEVDESDDEGEVDSVQSPKRIPPNFT